MAELKWTKLSHIYVEPLAYSMFKSSWYDNDELKYVLTKSLDDSELLNIKLSNDSKFVEFPITKSTSILKLGPFIGGHFIESCSFSTTVSIRGLLINLVSQNVVFSV